MDNQLIRLKIISSTTRPGRKGPAIAAWIADIARQHPEFSVELLDLGELNLPLMDEPLHPLLGQYQHNHTKQWSATIDEADAFVMVTAEYNHGMPAPLKNAIDYLSREWAYKPVGIVSYGGVSAGTRAAQMLKQVLTTLSMMPLADIVALPFFTQYFDEQDTFAPGLISQQAADAMLNALKRWTTALQTLRPERVLEAG